MERVMNVNETPADPSANRRFVLQQLRQRIESYKLRHRMCETQYDRHRREVSEREQEEARRLQQLLGEVARRNQLRQGRNGVKASVAMGDHQSLPTTSDELQGSLRRVGSPSLSHPPLYAGCSGQKSHTLPRQLRPQLQPPHQQHGIDTWSYNGMAVPYSPRSYPRSVSFPGRRNCDAAGHVMHVGQLGVVQPVKRQDNNTLPSCVFSQAPEAGSETDVQMSGDDGDLQSWLMQAIEDFPAQTDQLHHSTHEQNAFDLIEEVMRGSQTAPQEAPSMRFNPGHGTEPINVQPTMSLPSSPKQVRTAMFEERGHPVAASGMPPVRTEPESSMQYFNSQHMSVHQNQPIYGQQGGGTIAAHQQPFVPSRSGLPVQTTGYAPPPGLQFQGQHQQPTWRLHQDSVQSIVLQERERHQQQLQGSAPGSLNTVSASRVVPHAQQQQPQITVQPPSSGTVNHSVAFAQVGPNSGLMQSSDHSFQSRNHPFKAPQVRRTVSSEPRHNSFSAAWPPSPSSGEMLAPQSRDRSNSYHGQPSKLSVPYPTRSLTPPMRARGGVAVPDMSSSLGSTTPFSHFLPNASHQASASPETLSHNRGSTGSLANLVNSLLYRDATPGDTLPSPATMQNDTALEFDLMLSNPPSGFDLLSEIGNCVDDSTMDIGGTA